jgi:hypothetical protein
MGEDLMADWELEDIPPSNGKFTGQTKESALAI